MLHVSCCTFVLLLKLSWELHKIPLDSLSFVCVLNWASLPESHWLIPLMFFSAQLDCSSGPPHSHALIRRTQEGRGRLPRENPEASPNSGPTFQRNSGCRKKRYNKRGRLQTQMNARKRRQMQISGSLRGTQNAGKREQTQTNANTHPPFTHPAYSSARNAQTLAGKAYHDPGKLRRNLARVVKVFETTLLVNWHVVL